MLVSSIFILIISNIFVTKADDCEYSTSDGILDLKTLGYKDRPKFTNIRDTTPSILLSYSFNGCFSYSTTGTCQNAAACSTDITTQENRIIARQAGRSFTYANGLSTMMYTDGAGTSARVLLVCSATEVIQASRVDDKNFIFNIQTECACPGKCKYTPDVPVSKIKVGTIFIIVFFCILATYLIVGILYLRFVKHEQGANLIPNRTVWLQIGSDSIGGVRFILSKLTRRNAYGNI